MSLSPDKLARGLLDLTSSFPRDPIEAGRRWAHAYALYAADAMSIPPTAAPPNSLAANEQVLASALASVWGGSRAAPSTATGIASALTAFWLAPPVTFGAGLVTSVTGTSALGQALPGVWASNQGGRQPPEACTRAVASALDAFTRTVITTTPTGGPPVIGPIS